MRRVKRTNHKDDTFLRLTLVQLASAVLIFLLLFLLIRKDEGMMTRITEEFASLTQEDWDLTALMKGDARSVFSQDGGDAYEIVLPGGEPQTSSASAQTPGVILTAASSAAGKPSSSVLTESFYGSDAPVLPVSGPVTSDYGERIHPITGEESFHSGRDIGAEEGAGISAVYDGVVVDTGVGELSGNYVKIDHGDGLVALYCHCSKVLVEAGDAVRKGDVIAAVGHTGAATGPHLHFEIRLNGELTDPARVLDGAVGVR